MKQAKPATIGIVVLLALAIVFPSIVALVTAQGNNNPNKLWGAPSFNMNILGKKSDYNGDPSYESTDRHTMFVPENVTDFLAVSGYPNVTIWVNQGSEFAITDPNMFDDGHCNLTIGAGKYEVYFVALGKPGPAATLEGWIYNATDNTYLFKVGDVIVSHNKRPNWVSGHDMFYVSAAEAESIGAPLPLGTSEMWIFDYLDYLAGLNLGTQYLYLWNLIGGCKHIQVRFYQTS